MIKLISHIKIISQGQDYGLMGDDKLITSGLTKDEANDYSWELKKGHIVASSVLASSIEDVDVDYWKKMARYPFENKHILLESKYVTNSNELNRLIKHGTTDWVFMTIGATLVSSVQLGNRLVYLLYNPQRSTSKTPLEDFEKILEGSGIALACKLY
jgi:hypothetical protein